MQRASQHPTRTRTRGPRSQTPACRHWACPGATAVLELCMRVRSLATWRPAKPAAHGSSQPGPVHPSAPLQPTGAVLLCRPPSCQPSWRRVLHRVVLRCLWSCCSCCCWHWHWRWCWCRCWHCRWRCRQLQHPGLASCEATAKRTAGCLHKPLLEVGIGRVPSHRLQPCHRRRPWWHRFLAAPMAPKAGLTPLMTVVPLMPPLL
mmetsp:Transcript_61753/g.155925  ORF Transcript_61753/g.155925 Transcript_61753/m.155925 type:complete len:204 (+) Transcript_61753:1550-2161(+)